MYTPRSMSVLLRAELNNILNVHVRGLGSSPSLWVALSLEDATRVFMRVY